MKFMLSSFILRKIFLNVIVILKTELTVMAVTENLLSATTKSVKSPVPVSVTELSIA